jgi:hypothetical protein
MRKLLRIAVEGLPLLMNLSEKLVWRLILIALLSIDVVVSLTIHCLGAYLMACASIKRCRQRYLIPQSKCDNPTIFLRARRPASHHKLIRRFLLYLEWRWMILGLDKIWRDYSLLTFSQITSNAVGLLLLWGGRHVLELIRLNILMPSLIRRSCKATKFAKAFLSGVVWDLL